jgi:hypothetical protein
MSAQEAMTAVFFENEHQRNTYNLFYQEWMNIQRLIHKPHLQTLFYIIAGERKIHEAPILILLANISNFQG